MTRIATPFILFLAAAIGTFCPEASAAISSHVNWKTSAEMTSESEGVIRWEASIDQGWHIYGLNMPDIDNTVPPTSFTVDTIGGIELIGNVIPDRPATAKVDEVMALKLDQWEGNVTFTQHFRLKAPAKGAAISGIIRYMACSNKVCTPPAKEPFSLTIGNPVAVQNVEKEQPAPQKPTANVQTTAYDNSKWWTPVDVESLDGTIQDSSSSAWWSLLIWGFLGGLAALLTPCVWPMIPMTMSFFLKKTSSRKKSMGEAFTYGLSIIIIYLILGLAITVVFGAGKLNELATSAVFNLIFFGLLVVFAISFFGAFDIKLPSKWSNKIDDRAETTTGLLSIFFMAFTLVLVSFSCTGPIIGTLLVEAASQGNILGPALGMGGFALGLALPFSVFALFPSLMKEMPKSGGWLNSVKVVLGFLELVLSLKFLSVADLAYGWHILDREVFVALWIVLFVLLGMYLLGKLRFSHDSETKHVSVPRFFLALASLSFAVYLLPGMWGAPLKSVSAFVPPLSTQDFNLYGGVFREFDDYDAGMEYAQKNHMPVLIDFSGYACVNCRKMEGAVFDTQAVRDIIENEYVLIKLMVDDKTPLAQPYKEQENGRDILIETVGDKWSFLQRHKFGTNQQPFYVVLGNDGAPLTPAVAYDENVERFVGWLNSGVNNYMEQNR